MYTLFISDTHLCESNPKIAELFLKFLREKATEANALYILGDLFNIWIGDDNQTLFNKTIIAALRKLVDSGTPVFIMHGNRDFLIGKRFLKESGCKLLKDPALIHLYGVSVLLMHGDLLCTHDKKYKEFRKRSHNWLIQKLFLLQSLQKRQKIAERYRAESQAYLSQQDSTITDVAPKAVEHVMKQYEVQYLIHGHTHRPAIHQFKIKDKLMTRAVLGQWTNSGNMIIIKPQSKDKLEIQYNEFDYQKTQNSANGHVINMN